jgi:superfamily II DNA or RNA helicase
MKEYFSDYAPNYIFNPRYRSSAWNGKISIFDGKKRCLPYGVLFDIIDYHKKNYKDLELKVDDSIKSLFKSPELKIKYNLNLEPRDYQREVVEKLLKYTKGIARVATGGGKSLIISYILKILRDNKLAKRQIIIVPSLSLIEQFHSDMIEYGIKESLLGRVNAKMKEFEKPYVISTWQTLSRNHDKLDLYDAVVCDETHLSKSTEIKTILSMMPNTKFRFGVTGTLPDNRLDLMNVQSFIGPVLKEIPASYLASKGYLSFCNVNVINIKYKEKFEGSYDVVRDQIFTNEFRLEFINDIVKRLDSNVLLLVGLVEKEGELLRDYLEDKLSGKDVVFLSGRDSALEREDWRKKLDREKNIVLIATYPIFQQGVNIPSLKYLMMAAPYKSKIRVLQSIGRALRKHAEKGIAAQIIDIADQTTYFKKQGKIRKEYYEGEEFSITEYDIKEKQNCSVILNNLIGDIIK